jgi:membrane protein implicated in regulation of membrane protease activity
MLPIYLSALVFGGTLILFSILLGGESDKSIEADKDFDFGGDKDFDFSANVDAEIDADIEADAGAGADADLDVHGDVDSTWLPFLSMRFWTFGLTSFGLTGSILDGLETNHVLSLTFSIILGVAIGWVVAYAFHKLKKESVTSKTNIKELQNEEAQAILPIGPGKMGKVRIQQGGEVVDVIAQSNDSIARGENVLVINIKDGIADVCSLKNRTRKKIKQQHGEKSL